MIECLQSFVENNQQFLGLLGLISIITLLLTLLGIPWLITALPADYFVSRERHPLFRESQHPMLFLPLLIIKNLLGAILALLGIFLLFLPGQGLLTLLMGIVLLDFPGKYRFQSWLIRRRALLKSANWLRRRRGREAFHFDKQSSDWN